MQSELTFIRKLQTYAQALIANALAARQDLAKLETSAPVELLPEINEVSRQVELHRITSQQVWNLLEAHRLQLQGAMDEEAIARLEQIAAGQPDLITIEHYTPSDSSPTEKLSA